MKTEQNVKNDKNQELSPSSLGAVEPCALQFVKISAVTTMTCINSLLNI
jgi:hypothetical protein